MLNCEIDTDICHFPRGVHPTEQEVKQERQETCMDEQGAPGKAQAKGEVSERQKMGQMRHRGTV